MESLLFRRGIMLLIMTAMVVTVTALPILKKDVVYGASKKCTVTYVANSGKFSADKYRSKSTVKKKIKKNKLLGASPKITRDKHTFVGWYTKKNGGKKITNSTKVTNNMTLYAKWTKKYNLKTGPKGKQ